MLESAFLRQIRFEVVVDATRVGKVQTVGGLIEPQQLGVTLMHEHLLIDFRCRYEQPEEVTRREFGESAFSLERRGEISHDPYTHLDNLLLDDEELAIQEVRRFARAGGKTVVDTTTRGLGRDPLALRRISTASGLHVVMGAGYYVHLAHPRDMDHRGEDQLRDEMIRDIEVGVGDSGVRCGVIGEIGCEQQTPNEMKVVRAAAQAQRASGALLNIHQEYLLTGREGQAIADAIEAAGGDLRRTVFSHMDGSEDDFEYQVSLLERGIVLEYDTFGWESYLSSYDMQPPTDGQRIAGILRLVEAGWIDQLLLAQDICMKMMTVKYGGWGYGHILTNVLPRFRKRGLGEAEITAMLVENPRRLLPLVQPQG